MKYTKEILEPIVKESFTVMEVLTKLGLKRAGGTHYHISKKIKSFNIDSSHFTGRHSRRGKTPWKKYTKEQFIENVLILNGPRWNSHPIKLKLYEFKIKERRCEECNQKEIWNGKILSFHLDHIDGNGNDNRLENLRILCPNCHSQTETFSKRC